MVSLSDTPGHPRAVCRQRCVGRIACRHTSDMSASAPLSSILLSWYRTERRDLPWRRTRDAYHVWLSEVMLQQTRVETVIPYYERFLARFPRIEDLARAEEDDVLALWSGLGYYRRARSLLAGARAIVSKHGGSFPRRREDAMGLPGVGAYTAAAVLSIAYDLPHAVVDGNVERVAARILGLAGNPKTGKTARAIRAAVDSWLPCEAPGDFNQGLMELGATVCTPVSPRCDVCPLSTLCTAKRAGEPERFPEAPPRRPPVDLRLEAGLLARGDEWLLTRSTTFPFLRGLWVFPLVEATVVAPPGTEAPPVAEDVARALGVAVRATETLAPIRHSITFRRITIAPLRLTADPLPHELRPDYRWARLEDLGESVPVPSLCLKIARRLSNSR